MKVIEISRKYHSNILNSEGSIFGVFYEEESEIPIIRGRCKDGKYICSHSSKMRVSLYVNGVITLEELFLLGVDEKVFLQKDNSFFKSVFLEVTTQKMPNEIATLFMRKELYPLVSDNMKSFKDDEIKDLLFWIPTPKEGDLKFDFDLKSITPAAFSIFKTNTQFRIVDIENELFNKDEYVYLEYKIEENNFLLIKITPTSLLLFIMNKIDLLELGLVMECYLYSSLDGIAVKINNSTIEEYCAFAHNLYYYTLDETVRNDNPLQDYRYYQDCETANGRGVLYPNFSEEKDVDLKIIHARPL